MRPDYPTELDASDVETPEWVFERYTTTPTSLRASISPPPPRMRRTDTDGAATSNKERGSGPTPGIAVVEAGRDQITNHLDHFSYHLLPLVRPVPNSWPQLPGVSMRDWKELYIRNQYAHGRHWVVHQHDHPIAGVHYDLRLQISGTSSVSWAIMYGLPGSSNSRRLNRNATETRVHSLWVGV